MTTLVTGAFGKVGSALLDHTTNRSFRCLDRVDHPAYDTIVADIADADAIEKAFDGVDALVHLAAEASPEASWQSVLENNLIGGYNCLDAAVRNDVGTVVLASTNRVVGMYEQDHAPGIYESDYPFEIDRDTPLRPDSHYASAKVYNEALARYYVDNYDHPEQVYVLRFASVLEPWFDHPYGYAEKGVYANEWERGSDQYWTQVARLKSTWLSRRDCAQLIERCLDDDSVEYGIYFGVSDNDRRWFDIDHARGVLGYRPKDNGEDWKRSPEDGLRPTDESVYAGERPEPI